jgi:hypothetical protein
VRLRASRSRIRPEPYDSMEAYVLSLVRLVDAMKVVAEGGDRLRA